MKIAISAGHYPDGVGARFDDFDEWHEATRWAARICHLLGDRAVLVPTGTVKEKVRYVNARDDLLAVVEIHFNADPNALGEGSEALYFPGSERGRAIAEKIQRTLAPMFRPDRGVKEGWYRGDKKNGPIFMLAKTKQPAVIIEPEFVHNRDDIIAKREAACVILSEELRSLL